MPVSIASLKKVLDEIEEELRREPASLMESGKGVDDPEYMKQTRRLEALLARLSLAIKEIQNTRKPKAPDAQQLLKRARELGRRIREADGRSMDQGTFELLGQALGEDHEYREQLHQYHEMLEVPDKEPRYMAPQQPTESVEGMAILLFSLVLGWVQNRKKQAKRKSAR